MVSPLLSRSPLSSFRRQKNDDGPRCLLHGPTLETRGCRREPTGTGNGRSLQTADLSRCTWLIERQTLISNHRLPGQFHSSRRNRPLALPAIERPFGSPSSSFDFSLFLFPVLSTYDSSCEVFVHDPRKCGRDRAKSFFSEMLGILFYSWVSEGFKICSSLALI